MSAGIMTAARRAAAALRRRLGRASGWDEPHRLRHLLAHAPCLLWTADIEDHGAELLYWNLKLANPEAAQRFFPLKVHPEHDYYHAWYVSRLAEDRLRTEALGAAAIRAGRSYVQEFRCLGIDGEIHWFSEAIQVETIAPGRWRAAGVCTEITERHRREDAAREQAARLARAEQASGEILAHVAHELRNPLGAISNAVQLLKLRAGADPEQSRPLAIMERQINQQKRRLDDLLDLSRLGRGTLSLHRVRLDLALLLREVVEEQRAALEQAELRLQCELPPAPLWVDGDPTRLAQALGNLLRNAIQFTDPGGEVGVRCSDRADRSGRSARPNTEHPTPHTAVVVVRDTGIGIEPERLPHLFEGFSPVARPGERRGGLGLGLRLVKGLVEMHGGEIAAHSEGPGYGAVFTLSLPLADPAPRSAAPPRSAGVWRILVVDDNADAAASLQALLEALGCQVAVARSGTEGIERALHWLPEVVLCELSLPGLDGYEVAARLRQLPEFAATSLIALSSRGQEEDRCRSREAGFDQQLTKPIDLEELRRILEIAPRGHSETAASPAP